MGTPGGAAPRVRHRTIDDILIRIIVVPLIYTDSRSTTSQDQVDHIHVLPRLDMEDRGRVDLGIEPDMLPRAGPTSCLVVQQVHRDVLLLVVDAKIAGRNVEPRLLRLVRIEVHQDKDDVAVIWSRLHVANYVLVLHLEE